MFLATLIASLFLRPAKKKIPVTFRPQHPKKASQQEASSSSHDPKPMFVNTTRARQSSVFLPPPKFYNTSRSPSSPTSSSHKKTHMSRSPAQRNHTGFKKTLSSPHRNMRLSLSDLALPSTSAASSSCDSSDIGDNLDIVAPQVDQHRKPHSEPIKVSAWSMSQKCKWQKNIDQHLLGTARPSCVSNLVLRHQVATSSLLAILRFV